LLKVTSKGVIFEDGHELFRSFDKKDIDLFDSLLSMLNSIGTKVIINVMPTQPYYQQLLSMNSNYNERIKLLLEYMNNFKHKYQNIIIVKDNHMISDFNGGSEDFFDCMHPTTRNSNLMLYSIKNALK